MIIHFPKFQLHHESVIYINNFVCLFCGLKVGSGSTVGDNDGPLLRFYLKSASAVWDYILS